MKLREIERGAIVSSRFLTFVAVLGSLAGSVLMFLLGSIDIYFAFALAIDPSVVEDLQGTRVVINVIQALDRFLIAIVLLYFAYGVYSLFIHPEQREEELSLPAWLRVRQIGQLKQVVAELLIVILFVLFLRQALQASPGPTDAFSWLQLATLLVLPVSALLLSISLKLVQLHPKPRNVDTDSFDEKKGPQAEGTEHNAASPRAEKAPTSRERRG